MEIWHILKLQNILNSNSKPRFYTIIQIHSRTEKEKQTKELLCLIKCINKTPEHLHTNIFLQQLFFVSLNTGIGKQQRRVFVPQK